MKPTEEKTRSNPSDLPVYLFKQGNNCEAYRYFGAHIEQRAGETGVVFRVWAPHAVAISVVGDLTVGNREATRCAKWTAILSGSCSSRA